MDKVTTWRDHVFCHGDLKRAIVWVHLFRLSFNVQLALTLSLGLRLCFSEADDTIHLRLGLGVFSIYFGMSYTPIDKLVYRFLSWSKACERLYEFEIGLIHSGFKFHVDDIGWRDDCWKGLGYSVWPKDWLEGHLTDPIILSTSTCRETMTFLMSDGDKFTDQIDVTCNTFFQGHNRPWGKGRTYKEFKLDLSPFLKRQVSGYIDLEFEIRTTDREKFYELIKGFSDCSRHIESIQIG